MSAAGDADLENFLPDFCRHRTLYAIVLSAVVLALIISLAATDDLDHFWLNFGLIAFAILWISLLATVLICLSKAWLGRLSPFWSGLWAWLLILAATLIVLQISHWLSLSLMTGLSHQNLMIRSLGIAALLGALILRYLYENHQQKQRELAESQARFQALQARIRPHFLFNSLNTALSLLHVDIDKAEQVLYSLADLFRASLQQKDWISLEEEIELCRQYLLIEQLRFGNRLQVDWSLTELPAIQIPPLIVQPLVENAVHHGIEPCPQGGWIKIELQSSAEQVRISIRNSCCAHAQNRRGNRIALDNIQQRLALRLPDSARLKIEQNEHDYAAHLIIDCAAGQ